MWPDVLIRSLYTNSQRNSLPQTHLPLPQRPLPLPIPPFSPLSHPTHPSPFIPPQCSLQPETPFCLNTLPASMGGLLSGKSARGRLWTRYGQPIENTHRHYPQRLPIVYPQALADSTSSGRCQSRPAALASRSECLSPKTAPRI